MNSDKLNTWLTLFANIGVIIGIVFLAIEIRQNNNMIRAQTRAHLADEVVDLFSTNMNDGDYAAILVKGNKGEELTEVEEYQFTRHRNAWLWYWNNMVYQYQMGLYDKNEFTHQVSVVRYYIDSHPGLKKHWCESRARASSALIKAVEAESLDKFC